MQQKLQNWDFPNPINSIKFSKFYFSDFSCIYYLDIYLIKHVNSIKLYCLFIDLDLQYLQESFMIEPPGGKFLNKLSHLPLKFFAQVFTYFDTPV